MKREESPVSIASLSRKKQLAFGLLLLERMLPSLDAFSKDVGFDDSCYLRAKRALWESLLDRPVDQALVKECIRSTPDTEDFSHQFISYALNATLATTDVIQFAFDGNPDHIAHASTLARDSIHLYLGSLEPSSISSAEEDIRIARHPLMQQEQLQERGDINFIAALPERFDEDILDTLKERTSAQSPLLPLAR